MQLFKKWMFFLLMLFAVKAKAQYANIDSLEFIVKFNADNNEKLNAYKELSMALIYKDFDECQATAKAGAALAEKLKNKDALSNLLLTTGLSWYFKGVYDSAAVYYYKALDISKNLNNPLTKAAILNELGKLYRKTKDLDRALQMYDEAYNIYKNQNDETGMGTILNESGVVFEYKGNYDEAIKRYKASLAIREKMNDLVGIGYSYNFLGGVYTLQKNYAAAEENLLKSLEIRKQLKDSFSIALSYGDLGYMYKDQHRYDKAIEQYNLSNSIAIDMNFADLMLSNYKELSAIAEKQGNYGMALSYQKKYSAIKDSVYTNNKMKEIEHLNVKYQTEKKEQQLKLQELQISRKNFMLWGIIGLVILLLIAGISFFRKRQIQNKMNLQSVVMKQQDLATKAVITAEENERKRIAADLHDGVGQMMSAAKMNLSAFENEITFKNIEQKLSFEKLINLVDESCREIRSVSHQMMPNALLKSGLASAVKEFIDKIDNRIIKINLYTEGLHERLDSNTETILYRVIQECVNNVIKHSGASTLDISLIKDADGISATVEDNGRGFDTTDQQKFEGIGLKNISSRIEFLKGTVDFDSSPGKGTLVAVHVPLDDKQIM
ncbi:MAG: sensor histidine kinase [Ferruginibacter sp.]|nr:sensor histidine kinase [Ferruginibacter sp.]